MRSVTKGSILAYNFCLKAFQLIFDRATKMSVLNIERICDRFGNCEKKNCLKTVENVWAH